MNLLTQLQQPGEHTFDFMGAAGLLEAILTVPSARCGSSIALLGHPHSLQGGTMNNKVVTTLARACTAVGIPAIRFNFRGVGRSEGEYDAGIGESEDMLILARMWQEANPEDHFLFAGFSFGSYVAYRAACQFKPKLLISIAPPVHHYNYNVLPSLSPWIIIQGDEDAVVPPEQVFSFAAAHSPPLPVKRFAHTGHFFHGKLVELKTTLISILQEYAGNDAY